MGKGQFVEDSKGNISYLGPTKNQNMSIIAHDPPTTETLFGICKRLDENLHPEFTFPKAKDNEHVIHYKDPTNPKSPDSLDSSIIVGTANTKDFGSGMTLTISHRCLSLDTPIICEHGIQKFARDVKIGDVVVTHQGNYGRISAIKITKSKDLPDNKRMIKVQPWLGLPITMTPQHKVWTNMGWVKAGELDPYWHQLAMPIRDITERIDNLPFQVNRSKFGPSYKGPLEFPISKETGFFIGYYLAEGNVGVNKYGPCRITLALHEDEEPFAIRAYEAVKEFCKSTPKFKSKKDSKTKTCCLDSTPLARFVAENFGAVEGKHIPDWIFNCGVEFCTGLVTGYLSGDGSKGLYPSRYKYTSNAITATSIRSSLVYQVRDLVASLGLGWGSIRYKTGGVYYGRNCQSAWILTFNGNCGMRLRELMGIAFEKENKESAQKYRIDNQNNQIWMKIRYISESESDEVIDFEVCHSDHSFRVSSFSVSNSELAKWPSENVKDLLLSLDNAMPDHENTAVLNESTAKGVGGEFHKGYLNCRYIYEVYQDKNQVAHWRMEINPDADENNEYSRIFIPWFITKEYARPVPDGFKVTLEEKGWKEKYNLTDEQIQWYRWAKQNLCGGDKNQRSQEFPNCWQEAFISSGEPAFDVPTILHLKELCEPPIARYDCLLSSGQFIAKQDGAIKVWREPDRSGNYVIDADVSEGLEHGDFHSADVLDHDTGEQVCHYRGKMEPWEYAALLMALGKRYNEAWIVPEKNNHGQQVIQELIKADYPNIYMEMIEEPPNKPRKRFGWVTTGAGDRKRQALIDNGKKMISEGNPGINDPQTYEEMLNFKRQADGKERADNGTFDDSVMSWLIGQYVRETLPYATRTRKGPGDNKGRGGNQKKPSSKAYY